MAFPIRAAKKLSDYIPIFRNQGIDHVPAAGRAGEGMQHARVTQVGASPYTVVFADHGMSDMADGEYNVIVQGPNGDERANYATRTATGFNITGGANAENHVIIVFGRLAGQAR